MEAMPVSKRIEEPRTKKISFLRYLVFALWTLLLIGVFVVAWNFIYVPSMHSGTDFKFDTWNEYHLVIAADTPVTVEGESPDFYLLWNNTGEYVIGLPKPPPLGWKNKNYFESNPQVISPGDWVVLVGDANLHFTSPQPISVVQVMNTDGQGSLTFIIIFFGLAFWALVSFGFVLKKK